ncbi:MAG: hypothetical protein ACTSU2_09050 [Promethearchaeota archaeon]
MEYKDPYLPVVLVGVRMFFKGKCEVRIEHPVFLDQSLEPFYKIAKEIAEDMRLQVQSLLDGNMKIPPCRYEIKKPALSLNKVKEESKTISISGK